MGELIKPQEEASRERLSDRRFRIGVRWLVVIGASLFGALFLLGAAGTMMYEAWAIKLAREHFAATVGLPFAALAALCLVIILEITTGDIQIKGLGFEFSLVKRICG